MEEVQGVVGDSIWFISDTSKILKSTILYTKYIVTHMKNHDTI